MANELTLGNSLSITKNGATLPGISISGKKITVTGNAVVRSVQPIGTTAEELDKGQVGTVGYVQLRNLDTLNYIEVGVSTNASAPATYQILLNAGESAVFRANAGSTIWAKNTVVGAGAATSNLEYMLVED